MSNSLVAADWHADPSGVHQLRYWDGSYWTEHVVDDGIQSIDPLLSHAELEAKEKRAKKEAERESARLAKDAIRVQQEEARALAKAQRDEIGRERAEERAHAKAEERAYVAANPVAMFGTAVLKGGLLNYEFKKIDVTDATAEATIGAPGRRSTFTRMGAGALIAGPAGLIVGAVARKDTSKCYVTIDTPEGAVVVEGRAKDYPAAVKFADAVNRSKR